MILGHAFPPVVEAIRRPPAAAPASAPPPPPKPTSPSSSPHCFPSIEKLRFVSSGTEACMSAIRLARGFTGRNFIIKFEGCYHGHSDAMLVKAGSGVATLGIPGSAGVPAETAMHTLALPFNDLDAVAAAFAARPDEIACVIVEPVVGNAGTIPPAPGYLEGLRALTAQHGALLILDEVMTGFRLSLGGAQQLYSIQPDLTTLGKIIGGGLPCGAFGGRADIMNYLAPLGPVYQAGTLSGNPLAMAAGIATLAHLIDHDADDLPAARTNHRRHRRRRRRNRRRGRHPAHHQPRRLHVHLVLHRAARHRLRHRRHLRHRRLRPLPSRHARRRSLASAQPVRSRLRLHSPRPGRNRNHPRSRTPVPPLTMARWKKQQKKVKKSSKK